MRQGTTQFFYCCPMNFTTQFKKVTASLKKQKGNLLSLTEEPGVKPGWVTNAKQYGFHAKCIKDDRKMQNMKDVMRCTITYEVPK